MSNKGKIRRMFAGGNTSQGFYSLFDYILKQEDALRIFVIKGGPGVGKSTFMKKIGEELAEKGYDVEFHHCSSDPDSLDGAVFPSLKVAFIDGTAPHVVDPKNPGAVDEIINLGEYWNISRLEAAREEVISINKRTSRLFKIAYSHLREAKVAYDEWKSYISESVYIPRYNEILNALQENIFKGVPYNYNSEARERHLFASAITPSGLRNYMDTLVNSSMKSYAIEGEPGSGVKQMIMRIAQAAFERGLSTEQFHCPFEPESLDMVIIPEINTTVLNMSKPFHYNVTRIEGLRVEDRINLNVCIGKEMLKDYEPEMDEAKKRFYALMASAVEHLSKAKSTHDKMEEFYVPSMDFASIDQKRQEILDRILEYSY